jgi:hypothetical protein
MLFQMDQALDNTRCGRRCFIALGPQRVESCCSSVHKDPKDRDSWIKLMAIFRQEKMDVELAKAVREFRTHFPHESPPGG